MNQANEHDINNEKDVILDEISVKKFHWRRHLILMVLIGSGTWSFWTYSPLALQFKQSFWSIGIEENTLVSPAQPNVLTPNQANHNTPQAPSNIIDAPTFKPLPQATSLNTSAIKGSQNESALLHTELNIQQSLEQLQQQIKQLNDHLNGLHQQQAQQAQMQVRLQLFTALNRASSPNSSLNDSLLAWKSITLMPLLSEEKYQFAITAVAELQQLQQHIISEQQEVKLLINLLSQQLKPLEQPALTPSTTQIDPYQMPQTQTWLDWFQTQFKLSKVSAVVAEQEAHPHAPLQQLIAALQQYQQQLQHEQWQVLPALKTTLYVLDQRGIDSTLSVETLQQAITGKALWKNHALLWLEAL